MAALDTRLPLAGRGPDVMNALMQGTQAASSANQTMRQNALTQLYREQGPGIMAGEQGALNALATMSPEAALGVQSTRLGMDATRQNMDIQRQNLEMARRNAAVEAAEFARTLSVEQREAAQQQMSSIQETLMSAQTPEQYAALVQRFQQQFPDLDLSGSTWDSRMRDLAILEGSIDGLAVQSIAPIPEAEAPADEYGRYVAEERAAGREPLDRIAYAQAKKGSRVIYGPDGRPILAEGPAAEQGFDLSEAQSKNAIFATRAEGAIRVLEPVASTLTRRGERILEGVPMGLGRGAQSDDFQVAYAAGQEFLQAILRKDTGAAITEQEQVLYGKLYLPQPGDSEEVLQYRAEARRRAIDAIKAGMTPDALRAQALALAQEQGIDPYQGAAAAEVPPPAQGGPLYEDGDVKVWGAD
jgi:hypothetical protein